MNGVSRHRRWEPQYSLAAHGDDAVSEQSVRFNNNNEERHFLGGGEVADSGLQCQEVGETAQKNSPISIRKQLAVFHNVSKSIWRLKPDKYRTNLSIE